MIIWRRRSIIAVITVFFTIILVVNVYFVYTIVDEWSEPEKQNKMITKNLVKTMKGNVIGDKNKRKEKFYLAKKKNQFFGTVKSISKIKKIAEEIIPIYKNVSKEYRLVVEKVINELSFKTNTHLDMWRIAEQWVTGTQVLPERAPLLGSVLDTLCSSKIIKADNSKKGTQLKLLLTLEGGQLALFKPQWYPRDEIINGPVYAGRDRHNAEVAAFHLSLLLNLRRVPLTVGRKVNLRREVMPVATPELLNTFYQEGNNTCFYGVCLYCEARSPVCAQGDTIEGALIMWLPPKIQFERHPHPWRRSYKKALIARWEVEEDFCQLIKTEKQYDIESSFRLLDLIDAVVFDFLLNNGDRHHYEVPSNLKPSSVFLIDNGKGFGNPHVDYLDILAPLYQCCIIRKKTLEKLKTFTGGTLGLSLEETLKYSHIHPVLTNHHLEALDRRLILILAAVEFCIRENVDVVNQGMKPLNNFLTISHKEYKEKTVLVFLSISCFQNRESFESSYALIRKCSLLRKKIEKVLEMYWKV